MDIKNTILYDSGYVKSSSTENIIKQDIPVINKDLNIRIDKVNKLSNLDKKEKLEDIVESINNSNRKLEVFDRKLEISVHEKTNEIMVKVIDTNTDEIIRELPPEKVLDRLASRKEIMGILMDKKI